ncbi:fatty-acyl-CoA synthase [Pseudonocardia ammonioxydans]|uniref:Fatty-acyl-CoA synthase n=1 Tax=Pseudonocardia ammonioxydans TaxID=260086 RepID=A0A1I4XLD1_PSUAM|nr:long-chain fatty acid--CoA ligase [Pseudonocardia ammonioxydans]SFN26647.1 fatty-acyl-CoA synthase [Pseudonocardia ammonioxydans]
MESLMMDRQLLLSSLLWRTERLFHDKKIITRIGDGQYHEYTYREYGTRVRKLANALGRLGIGHGDRVGTLGWNHYRHMETYFGVPGTGAVLHTVNLRLFPEQQRFTINKVSDKVLIFDPDQLALVEELVDLGIPTVETFVVFGDTVPETRLSNVYSYEELIAAESDEYEFPEFDEHDAAAICFTSATTGDPKGVVYSHRGMVLQAMCLAMHDKLGMSEDQVWLEVAPMFHCNGWNIPHTALLQGSTLVLPGAHPQPLDYVRMVSDLKVTGMNAAVTIGTLMRDAVHTSGQDWDLSSLRTMWLGGQAPSKAIMNWWAEQYGTYVTQGWGMTENTPQICFSAIKSTLRESAGDDELLALRQKQGQPIPLVEIRILGPEGEELPWDGESVGDFWVRSPFTASAYYEDERTAENMVGGWFRTGDVGAIDGDGYVILKDRSKDLIKSGGEWISSIDLENALMAHPKVREATVVNIPDEKWLERPLACVVPTDDSLTEDELRTHLAVDFAKWSIPDRFLFVREVPKTGVGKYDKKVVRSLYTDGGFDAVEAKLG